MVRRPRQYQPPGINRQFVRADSLKALVTRACASRDRLPETFYFEVPGDWPSEGSCEFGGASGHPVTHGRPFDRTWTDLLMRIYHDRNRAWMIDGLSRGEFAPVWMVPWGEVVISPVDLDPLLDWDGEGPPPFPWLPPVIPEVSPMALRCFYVDNRGSFDVLLADDMTELALHRLLNRGKIDPETFALIQRVRTGAPAEEVGKVYANLPARLANLATVRTGPPNYCRSAPGSVSSCISDACYEAAVTGIISLDKL
jgi:hypothetical protein